MLLRYVSSQTRRIFIDCLEIFLLEIRIIDQDLFFGGACRKPLQHIPHRNPQPSNARLTRAFSRLDSYTVTSHDDLRDLTAKVAA